MSKKNTVETKKPAAVVTEKSNKLAGLKVGSKEWKEKLAAEKKAAEEALATKKRAVKVRDLENPFKKGSNREVIFQALKKGFDKEKIADLAVKNGAAHKKEAIRNIGEVKAILIQLNISLN